MVDQIAYAHSRPGEPQEKWEPLPVHHLAVANMARVFASTFDSRKWGYLAGVWHDIGKLRPEYQRRIRGTGLGRRTGLPTYRRDREVGLATN